MGGISPFTIYASIQYKYSPESFCISTVGHAKNCPREIKKATAKKQNPKINEFRLFLLDIIILWCEYKKMTEVNLPYFKRIIL